MFGDDGDDFEIIPCASCGRAPALLPGAWCADCASYAGAMPATVPAPAPARTFPCASGRACSGHALVDQERG